MAHIWCLSLVWDFRGRPLSVSLQIRCAMEECLGFAIVRSMQVLGVSAQNSVASLVLIGSTDPVNFVFIFWSHYKFVI